MKPSNLFKGFGFQKTFERSKEEETAENFFGEKSFMEENKPMKDFLSNVLLFLQFLSIVFAIPFLYERSRALFPTQQEESIHNFLITSFCVLISIFILSLIEISKARFLKELFRSFFISNSAKLSKIRFKYEFLVLSVLFIFMSFFTTINGAKEYIETINDKKDLILTNYSNVEDSLKKDYLNKIKEIEEQNINVQKRIDKAILDKKILAIPQNEGRLIAANNDKVKFFQNLLNKDVQKTNEKQKDEVIKNDVSLQKNLIWVFIASLNEIFIILCVFNNQKYYFNLQLEKLLNQENNAPQQSLNGFIPLPKKTIFSDWKSLPFDEKKQSLSMDEKRKLFNRNFLLKYEVVTNLLHEKSNSQNNHTLDDIAKICGVSRSTVDNVKRVYDNI